MKIRFAKLETMHYIITGQMKGALPTEQFTRVRVKRIFSNRLP